MMKAWTAAIFLFLLLASVSWAQLIANVAGGDHDFSPSGSSPIKGSLTNACLYCHAPHGGMTGSMPLWNQTLTVQTYTTYTSSTYDQENLQPLIGSPSKLCLSCHDGSIAPGQTVAYGAVTMTGTMRATSLFGTDLRASHPFSMQTPLVNNAQINSLLFSTPAQTADATVRLVNGTVECTTCHDPHFQGLDPVVPMFLVRESSAGKLCLACHDPTRIVAGNANYLGGWAASAHATSAVTVSNNPYVGGYETVAQNACQSCHMPHNASGPARLLRGGPDQQGCINCHAGSNLLPAIPNVGAEFAKTRYTTGSNPPC
jgi:predicted CXXCH cytochrome family protein